MDNLTFPPIPKDLLDELDKRFPDKMPEQDLNLDTIRFKQGQVSVLRFLKHQFELQNKTILESPDVP